MALHLTPSERETLEKGAEKAGAPLGQDAWELCLRRLAAAQIVAGTRRCLEARALMNQLTAIGNNLDQLTRVADTNKAVPHYHELNMTTDLVEVAILEQLFDISEHPSIVYERHCIGL